MKGLAVRKRFSGFCGFKGGGAAHKNIEAPRSINLAMPKSCIQVTSHQSLVIPHPLTKLSGRAIKMLKIVFNKEDL